MKRYLYFLIIPVSILIIGSSVLIIQGRLGKETISDYGTIYSNSLEETLEEVESIIQYGEDSVISAHFPIFGVDTVDSITRYVIESEIDKFNLLVKDSVAEDKNYKSELNIDYDVYKFSNNMLRIKFLVLENMNYYANPNMTIITKTYNMKDGRLVKLQDIMNEMSISIASSEDTAHVTTMSKEAPTIPGPNRNIDPTKPMVALTFDDGPNRNTTIPILNTLKEYNGVATFFILGNRVPNNEDILKRMLNEGSEIGNHSFNHRQLTTITSSEVKDQMNKTQSAIMQIVGTEPKLMRPTYGSYNDDLRSQIEMPMILWSIDTMDWKSKNAEKISNHVLTNVKDGDIILMHDIYGSTADAVKTIVPELINRGYQLTTVSELYELRGETLETGNIYKNSYKE